MTTIALQCLNCDGEITAGLDECFCHFINCTPLVCPHCDTENHILRMKPIDGEGECAFSFDLRAHIKGQCKKANAEVKV